MQCAVYLIVNVEVSLSRVLGDDSTFLQQKVGDFSAIRSSAPTELNFKILPLRGAKGGGRREEGARCVGAANKCNDRRQNMDIRQIPA